jgi:Tol biopolymer transport system component
MRRRAAWKRWLIGVVVAVGLVACGGAPPSSGGSAWLSVLTHQDGQEVAGIVVVGAAGVGGRAEGLTFSLGPLQREAEAGGWAWFDSRAMADGPAILLASASVAGRPVTGRVELVVRNEVSSSASVGVGGGVLRSEGGTLVTVPRGAVASAVSLSLLDVTQEEILEEFGIDYPALGVTFLGALSLEGAPSLGLPFSTDLPGWGNAVQPQQQVVMFAIAPDASGDGVGQLTFGGNALVAGDSVVSVPVPRSEVYGPLVGGGLSRLQAVSVRPGEFVTLSARGFNPAAVLGNVARFGGVPDLVVHVSVEEASAFAPLLRLRFVVPAVGGGNKQVSLHDLTTGHASDPVTLSVGALGGGSEATYLGFVGQVRSAVEALTAGRADLAEVGSGWLAALEAGGSPAARGMVAASGLVSAGNAALLAGLEAGSSSAAELVVDHALLLDALAVSESGSAAADLATLLLTLAPSAGDAVGGAAGVAPSQTGTGCVSVSPGGRISFGQPTGAGSAGEAGCVGGSGAGSGGGGALALAEGGGLHLAGGRAGSFGPVEGAFVAVYRRGTFELLSPFTAITDASGYYLLPFVPPDEPFTVRAVHPLTGATATIDGVTQGANVFVRAPLLFTPGAEGDLSAEFSVTPLERPGVFRFDNAPFNDPTAAVDYQYAWDFGAGRPGFVNRDPAFTYSFLRPGPYDVALTVLDLASTASARYATTVQVDLPQPYAATAPQRVSSSMTGGPAAQGIWYPYDVSADGRYVVFVSASPDLVPGDTNGVEDVFLFDRELATMRRVSVDGDGNQLDTYSGGPVISGDGSRVAYERAGRIEVHDLGTGQVRVVEGLAGLPEAREPALGGDGRILAFRSFGYGSPRSQVHAIDLDEGTVWHASAGFEDVVTPESPAISADGRRVAFVAREVDDEDRGTGVAQVWVRDLGSGELWLGSARADGTSRSEGWAEQPALSGDGRILVFTADGPGLLDEDRSGSRQSDVFVKDLETGSLELASSDVDGLQAAVSSYTLFGSSISANGRWVVFGSYWSQFVPMPFDACRIALISCEGRYGEESVPGFSFVKDRSTGWVALLTMGYDDYTPDGGDQTDPAISADGRHVIFRSAALNLAPDDTAGEWQLYWVENPLWEP